MSWLKKLDARYADRALWQFIKFNLVSTSITLVQLLLANLLPLLFDGMTAKLPPLLRPVFDPKVLFDGPSRYVVDGVVTWGYVLPFFLSNFKPPILLAWNCITLSIAFLSSVPYAPKSSYNFLMHARNVSLVPIVTVSCSPFFFS